MTIHWLPAAQHFKRELETAIGLPDPVEHMAALARLSEHRLSFLELLQLDRAIGRAVTALDAPFGTTLRLAVLGGATVDHLLPGIRVAGLRHGLLIDARAGAYGQYRGELIESGSFLDEFLPQAILIAPSHRDASMGVPIGAARKEADAAAERLVADLRTLWRSARERFGATVVQQSFLDVTEPLFGSHERLIPGAPAQFLARLNDRLADAASEEGILWLDVARAAARDGLESWFDIGRWLQGKMEISPEAVERYGELVARLLGAQLGRSRKALVLDLDNTLWGGVIGDDGLEGVVLGEGSAAGEAYLSLQRYAKQLADRGVILAICSKNDPKIAAEAFDTHPEMHLERSDLAAFVANWKDKSENLREISARLNIGLDSLVFVDDNPAERARIRESLPMVAVPELPDDPALYVRCIAAAGYFEAVSLTDEDRGRASQYAANTRREGSREAAQSMEEFLRGLEMTVTYGVVRPVHLARATQLINKTNQFNTTTRRLAQGELAELAAHQDNLILQFRLKDRFGDNGLVSVMLLCPDPQAPAAMEIANWVMSCRVFGRGLEREAMSIAVERAMQRGARTLSGRFIPTEKNGIIAGLFAELGFTPLDSGGAGESRWRLNLADYEPVATHITREAEPDDRPADSGQIHEHSA